LIMRKNPLESRILRNNPIFIGLFYSIKQVY